MKYFEPMMNASRKRMILVNLFTWMVALLSIVFRLHASEGLRLQVQTPEKTPQQVRQSALPSDDIPADVSGIFHDIEEGILNGNIRNFSDHFARQVYMDLHDAQGGYYSANQASYVLQRFFGSRRLVSFKLSNIGRSESALYATGGGTFMYHSARENLQVYVSLFLIDGRWVITQFNVY